MTSANQKRSRQTEDAQSRRLQRVVSRLCEQLQNLTNRADYVCAHRYDASAPVGTREIAVSDLGREASKARILLAKTANNQAHLSAPGGRVERNQKEQ